MNNIAYVICVTLNNSLNIRSEIKFYDIIYFNNENPETQNRNLINNDIFYKNNAWNEDLKQGNSMSDMGNINDINTVCFRSFSSIAMCSIGKNNFNAPYFLMVLPRRHRHINIAIVQNL